MNRTELFLALIVFLLAAQVYETGDSYTPDFITFPFTSLVTSLLSMRRVYELPVLTEATPHIEMVLTSWIWLEQPISRDAYVPGGVFQASALFAVEATERTLRKYWESKG